MKFRDYVSELGITEIISDLKNFKEQANEPQTDAIETMITVYENALKGSEEVEPLEEVLRFTVADEFNSNEKLNNTIRKHALVSMLFLVELSKQGKIGITDWLSSIVVSTKSSIDGETFETETTFNVREFEEKPQETEKIPAIPLIDISPDFLDISLADRLKGSQWLENNAPNNPKWSGYVGQRSLVEKLESIESFDREIKLQTLSNVGDVRIQMKGLNIMISKRFEEVINGYRNAVGIPQIQRNNTQTGADEVSFYSDIIENSNEDTIASTGKEVTINYFADSLFYKLARYQTYLLEEAKSFMLTIFITECKHIKDDKSDRYLLTYHYDLSEEVNL